MTEGGQAGPSAAIMQSWERHSMPRWTALALVLTGMALALAVALVLPALIVPVSAVPVTAERLDLQNAVRTTLLQAMGGILLVAGAYFTWRQL